MLKAVAGAVGALINNNNLSDLGSVDTAMANLRIPGLVILGAAVLDCGFTGPNYSDWLFTFLNGAFITPGMGYWFALNSAATPFQTAPANTGVFAKMSTAISGGTMTGKVAVIGLQL